MKAIDILLANSPRFASVVDQVNLEKDEKILEKDKKIEELENQLLLQIDLDLGGIL